MEAAPSPSRDARALGPDREGRRDLVLLESEPITISMARPLHREFVWIALVCAAFIAAWASVWAADHTDCDENGALALVLIGLGAVAVIAAVRAIGARLRWGIALAIPYAVGVYVVIALHAIGNCTA